MVAGCGDLIGDGRTVIRLASWGGAGDDSEFRQTERRLIQEFEEQNPDIAIRREYVPDGQDYVRKMLLNFIARAEPDIMLLDASSAAVFVDNGVLLDLRPLMEADPDFDIEDFWPNAVDIARRGEAIYAVPKDFTPMVLYYNKRLFDRAGVPYPQDGWTFDDFLRTAQALTDQSQGQYGFKFDNWMPGWIMWLWNNGGDVLSPDGTRAVGYLDSDQNVETVTFLRDMILKHRVAPSLSRMAALGVDLFRNGKAAMEISGHWRLIDYQTPLNVDGAVTIDDVGVVSLPTNIGQSVTVMYEAGFAIGRNCPNPEKAWRFVKYMTSRPVQEVYNATGIAISGRIDVAKAREDHPLSRRFNEIVPSARPPWGSIVEGYNPVESMGQSMMDSVLQQGVDVREALRKMANDIEREFAKR